MTASNKHILTNVQRMAADDELTSLWNEVAQAKNSDGTERTVLQTWVLFVTAADERRIADRIPGTTGRAFRSRYKPAAASGTAATPSAKHPKGDGATAKATGA